MPPVDQGASPERTRFAWRRTSLLVTVVVILALRLALLKEDRNTALAVTSIVALAWVVLLIAIQRRVRTLARPTTLRSTRVLMLTALACAALAAMAVMLVLI